jgi:ribonuclease HI
MFFHHFEHVVIMSDQVKIYVYGSCHFSELLNGDEAAGNGGYGVVINVNGQKTDEITGGYSNTTNARMDIMGIREGLKRITTPSDVTVYVSSKYIIDTLTKGWLQKWKKVGFKKKKHADLWQELDSLIQNCGHNLTVAHAKRVKALKEFILAEELAKKMSGKKGLPIDLIGGEGAPFESQPQVTNGEAMSTADLEDDGPILESISVDASTLGNPGPTEYRGVDTKTGELIFQRKYEKATNNIGEFLAIVHALALIKKEAKPVKVIYSDSANAISWVKQKKCKTNFEKTPDTATLFQHLDRAVSWLNSNDFDTKILKWNTGAWGEIPADYGRK